MSKKFLLSLAVVVLLLPLTCAARLTRLVITERAPLAGGVSLGSAGAYEKIRGTAYFEVDPKDQQNAIIVNLDRAPRNARGMVEFSTTFLILKPVDMTLGNHKIWYGVNNRGNSIELGLRSFPAVGANNDPATAADVGNNLILQMGFVFVDAGWQGNVVTTGNNKLVPTLPVATHKDGSPIIANTRVEYDDATGFTLPLSNNAAFQSYQTSDTNTAHSTLTVRDDEYGPRTPVPSDRWAFGTCPTGQASLVPTTTDICLFDGFQIEKIYELIYPAKNPIVMGLGYAVTRDLGSFLRHHTHDDFGTPNPLALSEHHVGIRHAYGSGTSSTGMYMRDWMYQGFNEDEHHRRVFDAIYIVRPGTHRSFTNIEFSDPNIYSRQDIWHDFTSASYPPQTFAVTTDPLSGIRAGILHRPETDPLVFQVETANEFWNMEASLNVVNGIGDHVHTPPNVRLYFLSSNSHGGSIGLFNSPLAAGICAHPANGDATGQSPTHRALLVALDEWADKSIEPPRSNYPVVHNSTLVNLEEAAEHFPQIPGMPFPTVMNHFQFLNFGPEFSSIGGIETILPPLLGTPYKNYVPRTDKDGLDVGGIRPMEIRAPLGTNTGWNLRAPGHRAGNICGLSGSYIPFATAKADRLTAGDPRRSLEERYGDHTGFVKAVTHAAHELVEDRFLLPEDAQAWIQKAAASTVLQ